MSKKKIITIIMSVLVAAMGIFTFIMIEKANQKSDFEILREAQFQMQQAKEDAWNKVLSAPDSCTNVPATIFARVCENEVYESETPIPWATGLADSAATCLAESYISKMELFAEQNGRTFERTGLADWQFIQHACGISGDFMLFIDDFDLDDKSIDAKKALDLWFKYDADEYCRKSKEHSWCNE
ncbi:MAG: hypothetical protein HKN88_09960 [Gammaproteobacteria bacterium]|nr:hypothetical protein [Gammaproteobacteria bacterium]NNC98381.1 hypothetical protein [Gammaproteobacteria bacterium]NNM13290.1 hypothetical protein [Gammaproteobacteria bacterium]